MVKSETQEELEAKLREFKKLVHDSQYDFEDIPKFKAAAKRARKWARQIAACCKSISKLSSVLDKERIPQKPKGKVPIPPKLRAKMQREANAQL